MKAIYDLKADALRILISGNDVARDVSYGWNLDAGNDQHGQLVEITLLDLTMLMGQHHAGSCVPARTLEASGLNTERSRAKAPDQASGNEMDMFALLTAQIEALKTGSLNLHQSQALAA